MANRKMQSCFKVDNTVMGTIGIGDLTGEGARGGTGPLLKKSFQKSCDIDL